MTNHLRIAECPVCQCDVLVQRDIIEPHLRDYYETPQMISRVVCEASERYVPQLKRVKKDD